MTGHQHHTTGRDTSGWGGLNLKNLIVIEVSQWLHLHAEEAKVEQNAEIFNSLREWIVHDGGGSNDNSSKGESLGDK